MRSFFLAFTISNFYFIVFFHISIVFKTMGNSLIHIFVQTHLAIRVTFCDTFLTLFLYKMFEIWFFVVHLNQQIL